MEIFVQDLPRFSLLCSHPTFCGFVTHDPNSWTRRLCRKWWPALKPPQIWSPLTKVKSQGGPCHKRTLGDVKRAWTWTGWSSDGGDPILDGISRLSSPELENTRLGGDCHSPPSSLTVVRRNTSSIQHLCDNQNHKDLPARILAMCIFTGTASLDIEKRDFSCPQWLLRSLRILANLVWA